MSSILTILGRTINFNTYSMKKNLYFRSWLLLIASIIALTSTAQTVKISDYSSSGTVNGYPLFEVNLGTITLSSSSGNFDYVYIDDVQIAYNSDSYWTSYALDVTPYVNGQLHKIQLKRSSSNYGICYFKTTFDEADAVNGLFYSVNGETASVIGAISEIETADIPLTYTKNGINYPVTSIGQYAFSGKNKLTSVTIPESVTSIGMSAFTGTALTSLEFNAQNCPACGSSNNPAFPSSITTLTIGNNVTVIPDYFLYNGSQIENLTIPNSVTSIGTCAFRNSSKLKSVVIPSSVTYIGSYAFYNCSSLLKSAYPTSISNPFSYGTIISYPPTGITDDFGVIYSSDKTRLFFAPITLDGSYTVPASVTMIGKSAFYACSGLTAVVIPQAVTSILDSAFYKTGLTYLEFNAQNCIACGSSNNPAFPSSIATLTIGNNVTVIPDYFLYNGSRIENLTIPNSVTSIGTQAFRNSAKINSVVIPQAVTSIGSSAFYGTGLTYLEFNAQNCPACGLSNNPAFPSSIVTLTIGNNVKVIPENFLYNGSRIENLTIPNSVTSIGNYAFRNSSKLKSVVIPSQVTFVSSSAFYNCSSLLKSAYPSYISNPFSNGTNISYPPTGITDDFGVIYSSDKTQLFFAPITLDESYTIPTSVTTIGRAAFYACSGLTAVVIPESVASIGNSAFYGTELTSLEFNAQNCPACGSSNYPAFPSSITTLTIGNNVTVIPDYFLYNGSRIENLTIPNSVTSIGTCAFQNSNSKLKSLTIGSGLLNIGTRAFPYSIPKVFWLGNTPPTGYNNIRASVNYVANDQYSFDNQLKYQFLSSKFTVDGTTYIPVSPSERTCDVVDCLYSPEFENVVIANKVVNRGVEMKVLNLNKYAFYDNDYLKTLNAYNRGEIGNYAFYGCDSMVSLQATNSGNIGDGAFYGCDNLQTATIQNTGDIGSSAFYGLKKLATATLGNNVTGILSSCFYGCSALTEFTIPDSVTEVGESAFQNCSSIVSLSIGKSVPSLPGYVFAGCSSLASLTIPNNIKSIGNYAFSGCASLGDVTIEDAEQIDEGTKAPQSFPDWTSTNHSNSSTSDKEYTFNVNPGDVLTFNYTVSSESGYDFLTIKLDGVEILKESGVKSGNYRKEFNAIKQVTLYMAYTKDSSNNGGSDNASVTDIWLNSTSDNSDRLVLGSNGNNPLFSDCPLDEVYIGRKLSYQTGSSYGYSPFYRNTSLRTVEITDAETQIYDNEFYGCSGLASLKIGNGVKTIGNWAFSGCSSLDYFSAGYMVESIGTEAFSDCTGLTKYYSYSVAPPVCGAQALDDINKWNCTLYVPDESSDEYQASAQWKDFFFIEEMAAVLVAEIRLNTTEAVLAPEGTLQLTAEVLPTNATNKAVEWSSSDESIATVSDTGLVTANAIGTATITAKSKDGNSEAVCSITVKSDSGVDDILIDGNAQIEVYTLQGYKISDSTDNLAAGIYIVKQGTKAYKISIK